MGRYRDLAQLVERYPFHELTVHDVVWWRPVWPILTLVAEATSRVLIGPDVTHPYLRHPVDTAANVAALDELSGGRAILGLGAGSMLGPVGIERSRPVDAVRECGELVQRFLRRDRTPYEGSVFHASEEAQFFWEPPRPRVPIFVGAFAPRMVEAAAAWADELRPPGAWAAEFFVNLKRRGERAASAAGRRKKLRVGCDVWLALDEDRDAARALGRRILAPFLPHLAQMTAFYEIDPEEIAAVRRSLAQGDVECAAERISDRTLDTFVAAGDADDVVAGVGRLVDAGASTITFSGRLGRNPATAIASLATSVLPEFQR